MNKQETRNKVVEIMVKLGAFSKRYVTCDGFDLEFWQVGKAVVIVQFWHEGGCTHYTETKGSLWSQMESDLKSLIEA
jgi:hypothetical protein